MLKYIFFGTPRFAEIILEKLLSAGMPPAALVCNPDRPAGRKKIVTPPPTKQLMQKHGEMSVFQPEKLDAEFVQALGRLAPDFFVVAAYAKIIPGAVLDIPRLGTLGVHPSLLPKYRGASPIQSAILSGEKETGVTIYLVDEKTDHGATVAQVKLPLNPAETYLEVEKKLAELGATLLVSIAPKFVTGAVKPSPQDEANATFTKKFKTDDAFIEESVLTAAEKGDLPSAEAVLRKINAFDPEPGAWTTRDGKRLKLLAAEIKNGALVLKKTR